MDNVIAMTNAFNSEELSSLIESLSAETLVEGKLGFDGVVNSSVRSARVYYINRIKYDWLYGKINNLCNMVNANYNREFSELEDLQYIVYESSGDFYAPHTDSSNTNNRVLSFSMQLSDPTDYIGGTLDIQDEDLVKTSDSTKGSITFFNSDMLHEVTPVTSGTRKVIVGWMHGKYKNN